MRHVFSILAGLFAIPACVMAQALPTMPPGGPDNGVYDDGGRYPAGAINAVSYYSPSMGANNTMYVYTPPGYNPAKKYAVVYGYPGIGAGADTIFAGWCVGAGTVADNLIGEGKIQPLIIVAIDDNNGDVQADTLNVIIPYIDSHYSTYADADHRGLYGYSWGGGYTFNIGCGNLNTFRHIAPSSAAPNKAGDDSLFPNGGAEAKRVMKTLLIACGNADYLGLYGSSEGAHNYCVANGIPHAWWPVNGGGHDGGVWRPHMWNFLQMADAAGISDPPRSRSAYSQIEAEDSDTHAGGSSESCSEGGLDVGSIVNGNYAVYRNVDFSGGATNFQARVASATSGGNIEVRLDATNGTLVGTCAVTGTGGWQTWVTRSCTVSGATGGVHNVYLVFTGGSGYLFNVNWWRFGGPGSPVSVPSVPGGLVATAGIERAVLRWTASSSATSYNVKRAATSGGTYTTIANVAGTNYTDRGVFGGTTNYYKVSALNVGGESTDSVQASVTPTVTVPSPWLTRDLGAVGLAGSASFTNGVFSQVGSGADIGGTADAFRFAYVTNSGDCTIIARVTSLESHINAWSKAGVMIRESLATNAANVFVGVTPGNGVTWQYRSSTGGGTTSNNTTGLGVPYWVKLVRSGNTFTASRSTDGVSWTPQGTTTIAMASTVYVGLAINSHNLYTLCAATFDHVTGPGWAPSPVLAPTSLVATAGVERVALNWPASANATSYNVKRATTSGGPYTTITTVTTTNYTDTFVIGRTTYYYVVSALNNLAGESGNSAQASATPILNVPSPWMTRDIGTVGLSGGAGYTNGVFTVTASGDDIWNSADAFRFVYVTNSGNFSIVARVVSVSNSDPSSGWSKAGLMVRESLDANAANAFIAVTPGNGVTWQSRLVAGNGCNNNATSGSAPYWVKLVRSGNVFTGYCSPNGTTWTQLGSTTLTNVTSTAYIGLAVTAHNNSSLCMATFDNVSLPGWPPPLLTVDAVAASSSEVSVTWNALTNATSYSVKRSATSGGPYTNIATGLTATNYTDTVASVRLGYCYVVSAMIGGSETTNSPEAAVRFLKLTGGIIGTAGSWGGSGDTIAKVFDGDLTTFFDAPNGNGAWVGLDFGAGVSNVIVRINYCPRSGSESRMTGGVFQGANQANFSGAVTLYTVTTAPASGAFTSASLTNTAGFRYVRYLSPNDGFGNVAELEFYGYLWSPSTPAPSAPTGLVATAVSSGQIALTWNAVTNAASYNVKRSTTNGGTYTLVSSVTTTNYTDAGLTNGTTYYYVVSALNAGGESTNSIQASAAAQTAVPTGLSATAVSISQINLVWNGSTNASSYNVKRSTTNGGPYSIIAPALTTTNYQDSGLAGGTMYYYVVSAIVSGDETSNSAQAAATTFSPTLDSLVHRYSFGETGGASVADSVGGPVWTGILPNGGTFSGGQLTLVPGSQQYASLPSGVVSSLSNFTVMAWVNLASVSDWCRVFDFWNNLTTHMFLTPQCGGSGTVRFEIMNGGGAQQINCNATMSTGVWHQVAVTLTGTTGVLYLDGVAVGTNSGMTINPSSLGSTINNYIGKSEYANPYLDGSIDEFRIYNAGLSAAEVAATYALGWGQLLSTNSPAMNITLAGASLTVSWPLANAGFTVQSRTNLALGDWVNVASPVPQVVGSQWQVVLLPSGAPSTFYRLSK